MKKKMNKQIQGEIFSRSADFYIGKKMESIRYTVAVRPDADCLDWREILKMSATVYTNYCLSTTK